MRSGALRSELEDGARSFGRRVARSRGRAGTVWGLWVRDAFRGSEAKRDAVGWKYGG